MASLSKLKREIQSGTKKCIFCLRVASSIEHCPPKIFFIDKRRPRGLEFPACETCNEGHSASEQVFSFFIYSSIFQHSTRQWAHFQKIAQGVHNNQPELIDEIFLNATLMESSSLIRPARTGPIHVTMGNGIRSHVRRILDKLALGIYSINVSGPEPSALWIRETICTNYDRWSGRLVGIPRNPGKIQFLGSGKAASAGQFAYQFKCYGASSLWIRVRFQDSVLVDLILAHDSELDLIEVLDPTSEGFRRPMTSCVVKPSTISFAKPSLIIPSNLFA